MTFKPRASGRHAENPKAFPQGPLPPVKTPCFRHLIIITLVEDEREREREREWLLAARIYL